MDALLSLFPPGSAPDADGMLRIGGCRADELAAEFGTPVLVVSERALRARAREYVDELAARWPRSRVVFASKAFPCTAVQRVMVEEGLGLDVAGGGEILTALKGGVDPALVVLHGNAKSDEEIAMAVEHGLGLVVVDNGDDVDRLEATVPDGRTQDVLVRVIPGVTADTHAHVLTGHAGSKFGLAPAAAAALIRRIERSPRLEMQGLHVHIGSQILEVEPFAQSVAPLAALGELPVYDLGGGLGARYTYDDRPPALGDYLDALVGAAREHLPAEAELIIEPGRSMVATAAATLYRVVTVKRGEVTFVAVDGGMGDNLEVALFDQRFEAGVVDRLDSADGETVTVVGRHCESGDVLVEGVPLDAPRVGDLLGVPASGAYCFTMAVAGLTAICYAELASAVPVSGSSYSYAYATLGEGVAMVVAACLLLEYGVSAAAVAVGWSQYLNELFDNLFGFTIPDSLANAPEQDGVFNLPAVILVLLCTALLIRGASESAKVNAAMVLIKIGVLLFFVAVGLQGWESDHLSDFTPA